MVAIADEGASVAIVKKEYNLAVKRKKKTVLKNSTSTTPFLLIIVKHWIFFKI